jgi:hypothetical protein
LTDGFLRLEEFGGDPDEPEDVPDHSFFSTVARAAIMLSTWSCFLSAFA